MGRGKGTENERNGFEVAGIRFAPLSVPLRRRLQLLSATTWFLSISVSYLLGWPVLLYILVFTKYRWAAILYCFYMYHTRRICETGGKRSKWFQTCAIWKYISEYFSMQLIKVPEAKFDPKKNYLVCTFPHGLGFVGQAITFCTDALDFEGKFPGMKPVLITLTNGHHTPLYREIVGNLGCISSSAESINFVLNENNTGVMAALVVGGSKEMLNSRPGNYVIVLKRRKGFVRLALMNGTALVPAISFGEIDLYDQSASKKGSVWRYIQNKVRRIRGFPLALIYGRGFFQYSLGFVPRRRRITMVVGKPIEVPKDCEPTQQKIDEYHSKFVNELVKLFESEKHKYIDNAEKTRLIID